MTIWSIYQHTICTKIKNQQTINSEHKTISNIILRVSVVWINPLNPLDPTNSTYKMCVELGNRVNIVFILINPALLGWTRV